MLVRVEGCNIAYLTTFSLDFCVSIFRHMTHGPLCSHRSPASVMERLRSGSSCCGRGCPTKDGGGVWSLAGAGALTLLVHFDFTWSRLHFIEEAGCPWVPASRALFPHYFLHPYSDHPTFLEGSICFLVTVGYKKSLTFCCLNSPAQPRTNASMSLPSLQLSYVPTEFRPETGSGSCSGDWT